MPPQSPRTPSNAVSYRPSAFYWRKGFRDAATLPEAQDLGFTLCTELEQLKAWVREQGLIPPRFNATAAEAEDKWAAEVHAAPLAESERLPG